MRQYRLCHQLYFYNAEHSGAVPNTFFCTLASCAFCFLFEKNVQKMFEVRLQDTFKLECSVCSTTYMSLTLCSMCVYIHISPLDSLSFCISPPPSLTYSLKLLAGTENLSAPPHLLSLCLTYLYTVMVSTALYSESPLI